MALVTLKPIDPTTTAVRALLRPLGAKTEKPSAPPRRSPGYTGDPKEAFWAFDEELAKTIEAYNTPTLIWQERGEDRRLRSEWRSTRRRTPSRTSRPR